MSYIAGPCIVALTVLLQACSNTGMQLFSADARASGAEQTIATGEPPAPGLRRVQCLYSYDLILSVEIVAIEPLTEEMRSYRDMLLKDHPEITLHALRVIPKGYVIPCHSYYSTSQYQLGEFWFDPRKLAESEEKLRTLIAKEDLMMVSSLSAAPPSVAESARIGVTVIPGFAYYGIPTMILFQLIPSEVTVELVVDAEYPSAAKR